MLRCNKWRKCRNTECVHREKHEVRDDCEKYRHYCGSVDETCRCKEVKKKLVSDKISRDVIKQVFTQKEAEMALVQLKAMVQSQRRLQGQKTHTNYNAEEAVMGLSMDVMKMLIGDYRERGLDRVAVRQALIMEIDRQRNLHSRRYNARWFRDKIIKTMEERKSTICRAKDSIFSNWAWTIKHMRASKYAYRDLRIVADDIHEMNGMPLPAFKYRRGGRSGDEYLMFIHKNDQLYRLPNNVLAVANYSEKDKEVKKVVYFKQEPGKKPVYRIKGFYNSKSGAIWGEPYEDYQIKIQKMDNLVKKRAEKLRS